MPWLNRSGVSPHNHPHPHMIEPLLWSIKNTPLPPSEDVVFEGKTTTTDDGRQEYTVSIADIPPEERMTHWLTVDADAVVSLENTR